MPLQNALGFGTIEAMRFRWFIGFARLGLFSVGLWLLAILSSCVTKDRQHRVVVSVADQTMDVYRRELRVARYPVSTSRFCLGDAPGSFGTPLGHLEIAKKIGGGAPLGMVFRDRKPTGEVLKPDAPGRDPIVTRILWLKGRDPENRNAYARCIYIHGTPEERNIGRPASYGCIRMRSRDVAHLFGTVGVGAEVDVILGPLPEPGTSGTVAAQANATLNRATPKAAQN
jgi:L,D-transpeptidase catalytic domain